MAWTQASGQKSDTQFTDPPQRILESHYTGTQWLKEGNVSNSEIVRREHHGPQQGDDDNENVLS